MLTKIIWNSMMKIPTASICFSIGFSVALCANAAPPVAPQVALVAKLYKVFSFEAVVDDPQLTPGFLDSDRAVLLSYLTPELAAAVIKDRKCAAITREICKLDFMPLWDSQDPAGATVRVLSTNTKEKVKVEVRYASSTRTLTYQLVTTKDGWRIADITFERGRRSLLEILSSPS